MSDLPRTIERQTPPPSIRRRKTQAHRWTRWLHVYTSMISLVIVLFFGLTGITLNHPDWTFGDATDRRTFEGTLPAGSTTPANTDFLAISEFVRATFDVKGAITDYGTNGADGTLNYKGPGYSATLFFRTDTGTFDLNVEQQGFLAVMNDLHKGRDTDSAWNWVVDLAGGLLVLVAATGLGIQLFLRKRRTRALLLAAGGTILTVVGIVLTIR